MRLRDLLWRGCERRFVEGEIVRVSHDLLRGENGLVIPFWQLRTAQEGPEAWRYFSQAVPIGLWPGRFAWLEECQVEPTGVTWCLLDFEEQDQLFAQAGRGSWRAARREDPALRTPLAGERDLVRCLKALGVASSGAGGRQYRALLARLAC